MKLQACPRCGAKFDVSAFAKGQQFSCGACRAVITAHAGVPEPVVAGRAPGSRPSAAPPAGAAAAAPASRAGGSLPSSSAATGGVRGPQYRPVERHPTAAAAPAAPPARPPREKPPRDRRAPRGRDGDGEERKLPPVALYALGGLVVLGVVAFLALGSGSGKKDDGRASATPPGGPGPAGTGPGGPGPGGPGPGGPGPGGPGSGGASGTPKESVETIEAEMAAKPPATAPAMRTFAKRLLALAGGAGKEKAAEVYRRLITDADPNDAEARTFLGFKEFKHDVPEDVAYRNYPFIEAVEEGNRLRWFDDPEALKLVEAAWQETKEHAQRLRDDQEYRGADGARANIAQDAQFKGYNYTTRWARPYLICYSSSERLSEYDLLKEKDASKRREQLAALKEKRRKWERVLDEKARIFTQLYTEWMKRYAGPLELKDLMEPYGGRADYAADRSFRDGVPLIVWIFTDHQAFTEHHTKSGTDVQVHPAVGGYFNPKDGRVYLFDNEEAGRQEEINKNVHEGTHQLEYWFAKQRNKWGKPLVGQSFMREGLAEYLGAVKIDRARNLAFVGVNAVRLLEMQQQAQVLKQKGKEYRFFPLERLVGFTSYAEPQKHAVEQWQIEPFNGLVMFYEQAYALVYWLNEVEGAKHREAFHRFLADTLSRMPVSDAFQKAFNIRDEEDWQALEAPFHAWMTDKALKMNLNEHRYTPPARDDWPDSAEVARPLFDWPLREP